MLFVVDESSVKEVREYWKDQMPIRAMEECGELIQAISKSERDRTSDEYYDNLKKEMADVIISIAALCSRYHIDHNYINDAIDEKLNRRYE